MLAQSIARPLGVMVALLMWLAATAFTAEAQRGPDFDEDAAPETSFSELERWGRWTNHPEWGTVWVPDVDRDWRPYTVGRWVNTEEHGWYWDSEEPFGWAVYHYGRWTFDESEGWMWVPGTEWGPAWVAWRYGEDAVGWAPLPPAAVWNPDRGLYIEDAFYEAPRYNPFWIFVAPRYLLASGVHHHCLPWRRNVEFFRVTRPATHYAWSNRRIYNHGIRVADVERLTRSRVAPVSVRFAARPSVSRGSGAAVVAFRPTVVPSSSWRAGRSGDWRRFDITPAARQPARADRDVDRPRRDNWLDSNRGFPRDSRGADAPRFDRDRFERNRDSDRGRDGARMERPAAPPAGSVPSIAPNQGPPRNADGFRRDFDRLRAERSAPTPPSATAPRNEPPRADAPRFERDRRFDRQREEGDRPRGDWRADRGERRGDAGSGGGFFGRPFENRDFRSRDGLGAGPAPRVEPPAARIAPPPVREPQRPAFAPPPAPPARQAIAPPPPPPRPQMAPPSPPPRHQAAPPPRPQAAPPPPPSRPAPAQAQRPPHKQPDPGQPGQPPGSRRG